MLKAKRVLILIAIVLCAMQIPNLTIEMARPKSVREDEYRRMNEADPQWIADRPGRKEREVVLLAMFVWCVSGLISLSIGATVPKRHALAQLSFGVAGISSLLVGCAGGFLSRRALLWPRLGLSFLTLYILLRVCLLLQRGPSFAPGPRSRS